MPGPDEGRIPENVARLVGVLRAAGVPIGPAATLHALDALRAVGLGRREDVYWALHAALISRREHAELFHGAFHRIFRRHGYAERMMAALAPPSPAPPKPPRAPRPGELRLEEAFAPRREAAPERRELELSARLHPSDAERLRRKDFAQMTREEVAQALRLVARLSMPDDAARTRRFAPAPRGSLDPRRSFRAGLRGGGAGIALAHRTRVTKLPPVVALLDVSGSMDDYARPMLHFLHALSRHRRVRAFVFATRLTEVGRALRGRDPDEALARVSVRAQDWAGGTRITEALHRFNRDWSRRVLGQGAVVLLVTDGLERGVVDDLAAEAARLRRSCRRLVWLNPLLRYSAFEPRAAGVRALRPNVDDFRPVHDLASMAALVAALSRDGDGRSGRGIALRGQE